MDYIGSNNERVTLGPSTQQPPHLSRWGLPPLCPRQSSASWRASQTLLVHSETWQQISRYWHRTIISNSESCCFSSRLLLSSQRELFLLKLNSSFWLSADVGVGADSSDIGWSGSQTRPLVLPLVTTSSAPSVICPLKFGWLIWYVTKFLSCFSTRRWSLSTLSTNLQLMSSVFIYITKLEYLFIFQGCASWRRLVSTLSTGPFSNVPQPIQPL